MPLQLTLVTSDSPAVLLERLALDLARAPLSPLQTEVVVVQSQGTERWVRHELARRHGCAASLEFPFPAGFCQGIARRITGEEHPFDDRFTREAMTWGVLALLENGAVDEPDCEPLRRFVQGADTRMRLGLAVRIAARFDDYQLYRPDVLLGWERGDAGDETPPHVRWQMSLWRQLCAGDTLPLHLARWFTDSLEELERCTTAPANLPPRVSVFGVSTLPPIFAKLLRALAHFIPVRAYILAPACTAQNGAAPANPLALAFGTAARELVTLFGDDVAHEAHPSSAPRAPLTALATLQDDLRLGVIRTPDAGQAPPVAIAPDDDSLTVHVCHSPMREVEVLRDQLLAALAADPTLRPHDILVLVPDVATYAPFVEAVFGVGEQELPRIPYRVADRTIAHESSLADAALRILALAGARWTVPEIIGLLDVPAVRRAAVLDEGAPERILRWIEETRIRWGRDGAMRKESFDLPALDANSWRAGMDRLLMGYAIGPENVLVSGILPYSGHTIGAPATLGAFAHWTETLFDMLDGWRAARTPGEWSDALHQAFTTLLEPDGPDEERAHATLLRALEPLRDAEARAGYQRPVDVGTVRDWLERALADDSSSAGFLSGGMTVCAFKPMRAIPFRVIAMLGLDDSAFPRRDRRAAYDLLEIEPRPGDRTLRTDDRQLFLDTLLSAGERLILSYVGRSERDNSERAASVVVAELLDVVDRSFASGGTGADGKLCRARDAIVVLHRLQPFSPAYYRKNDGVAESRRLFSYSRVNARGVKAIAGGAVPNPPFVATPVVATADDARLDLTLDDLIACWINPSRFFCERVLDLRLPRDREAASDCEPMAVDGLTQYNVCQRILESHLAGARARALEREHAIACGELPSGLLGGLWFDRLDAGLDDLLRAVGRPAFLDPVAVQISGATWSLTGRVDGVIAGGRLQPRAAKVKPKDLVRAWVTHLALSAMRPGATSTVLAFDGRTVFAPVDDALARLDELVAGYRSAQCAPLPVFERASATYVEQDKKLKNGRQVKPALEAAREVFEGSDFKGSNAPSSDRDDQYVALCWRGRDPLAGGAPEFIRQSTTLWDPMWPVRTDAALELPA